MTSNDQQQYLTVDMFNSRMDTLMAQIRLENEKLRSELRTEFQAGFATLQTQTQVNSAKIEMLQHTFYWGFGIMTIVIALITIFVPSFSREAKQKQQEQNQPMLTEEKVQDMISRTVNDAVTKALGVSRE